MGMDSKTQPGTTLLPIPWVSRAHISLPVSQGRQEDPGMSRDAASAASSLQTPGCFLPSPQLPTPLPPVALPPRGHCHCPPCQAPTRGTPGTGRGSCGQRWKKQRPTEPGVRYSSCQGLSLTHLTLFLLCPHQQDLLQVWGGGTPGGCCVSQMVLLQGFPQTCLRGGSGTGRGRPGPSLGPSAGAGPNCWEQPPLPCFTRRSFQLWLSHSCCSSFSLLVLDGSFPWKPTLGRAAGWDKHG